MLTKHKDICAVFDSGPDSGIDHYTIVLIWTERPGHRTMIALGDDVTSPLGFSQFCEGVYSPRGGNQHLGKRIGWNRLPEGHKRHVIARLSN